MKSFVILFALCATAYAKVPRFDGRIVGGKEVEITSYPHQVSVRVYDQHICGGSIINSNTILTAAHCVHDYMNYPYNVRVGNKVHSKGTNYNVNRIIENPDYNTRTMDNDVAILKLSSSISFSSAVQAIALQPRGVEVAAGTNAWVSGWGDVVEGNEQTPDNLRAVDVSVITQANCNSKYGAGRITAHMLCAQTLGHDSCQGDSGGPLVAGGKLIGVVSWGIGCARPNYPGVYAKVSNTELHDWISKNSA